MEKTIEQMTSEQLALALNQMYGQLMQAQQNIAAINRELEQRQKLKDTPNDRQGS